MWNRLEDFLFGCEPILKVSPVFAPSGEKKLGLVRWALASAGWGAGRRSLDRIESLRPSR
jgi:hypothetical protein